MRIGIDIDDTITNTYKEIVKILSYNNNIDFLYLYNMNLNYDELFSNYHSCKKLSKEDYTYTAKNVELKEDALKVINELSQNNEIIFITARNNIDYDNSYLLSKNYLDSKGIKYNEIYTGISDKGKFCNENNIDLFIDDSINNCSSVKSYGIDVLLYDNIFNRNSDLKRVSNWKEILKYIRRG